MDYLCTCGSDKREIHGDVEYAPMITGRHTNFMVLVCQKCHKLDFIPRDNYDLFITIGTDEAITDFEKSAEALVISIAASQPSIKDRLIVYLKKWYVYWPYAVSATIIGVVLGMIHTYLRGR